MWTATRILRPEIEFHDNLTGRVMKVPLEECNEMHQNATDTESGLSAKQVEALELLLTGHSVTSVAESVRVDRTTVHRWLKEDFEFQAILNRCKRQLLDAIDARLLALGEKASTVVAQAVDRGDVRVSLEILKGLGRLSGKRATVGSDDPEELRKHAEIKQKEWDAVLRTRELLAKA